MFGTRQKNAVARGSTEPFDLEGSRDIGVLCVHGFTGSPFEMRYLGETLHRERGWTVVGPRLAGHGLDAAAVLTTTWRDWYRSVDEAFALLSGRVARVGVVGLSLGSLLSLELARRHGTRVAALVAMSTPLWLGGAASLAIRGFASPIWSRVFGRGLSSVPKPGGGSDIRDPEMRARNPSLTVFPVAALRSLLDISALVRLGLEDVQSPTLVVHAKNDHTAPFACSLELYQRLAARGVRTEKLWLERSFHVIPIDVERDRLAREVGDFLSSELGS